MGHNCVVYKQTDVATYLSNLDASRRNVGSAEVVVRSAPTHASTLRLGLDLPAWLPVCQIPVLSALHAQMSERMLGPEHAGDSEGGVWTGHADGISNARPDVAGGDVQAQREVLVSQTCAFPGLWKGLG